MENSENQIQGLGQKTEEQKSLVPDKIEQMQGVSSFGDGNSFAHAQRVAKMLSASNLIPGEYRGNIQNTMIALEMANRIGASPLMVMQNLYLVHGKPSWSSSFIIASINSCGKFSPLRFEVSGEKETLSCFAWAYDKSNGEKLIGPEINMEMAKSEGWLSKNGSKWKTMPQLMIRYRSAAFFGRLYAPEIMMGMHTMEEVIDISAHEEIKPDKTPEQKENDRLIDFINNADTPEKLAEAKDHLLNEEVKAAYVGKLKELTTSKEGKK